MRRPKQSSRTTTQGLFSILAAAAAKAEVKVWLPVGLGARARQNVAPFSDQIIRGFHSLALYAVRQSRGALVRATYDKPMGARHVLEQ